MVTYLKQHIRRIRHITNIVSIALTLLALAAFAIRGLNMGLDFTGGMVTEVRVDKSLTHDQVLNTLKPEMGDSTSVIQSGEEGRWVIRYPLVEEQQSAPEIETLLNTISSQIEVVSNSMVGSQVGEELIDQGGLALLICILCILGYLSFRFEWRLASGALLALFHGWVFFLGVFFGAPMGVYFIVFSAPFAILGYSLKDSILIFARIREFLVAKTQAPPAEI
ncbi:protein translocase subunit SecF, partial [Vibrio sp. V32_P6A28T40]|uniref:protein translocase subunit SecF n=1 Tax=Vibrio sp. V32_P6A28T40 TaxID=1938684 RepID=UPI0013723A01